MRRHGWWGAVIAGLVLAGVVVAGDWPQFRYDAGRTAASPEQLPAELGLRWVRQLPQPRPAFPIQVRLLFDASYEPVVSGKTLFVPSMVTDSLTALDTETGRERWRFYAGGPIRFAPVAWRDKVYVVSDDGYLYCLAAADGRLLWKFRGLPAEREDRKLLGNGRLISLWPARGGPVLADGVLYFAVGLWPSEGVYIYALDPASGKVIWKNDRSNRIAQANMDHGIGQYAGLTPQGYLAVLGDKLAVPCGAQLPAFLDLRTGELADYQMGWGGRIGLPKGSWFVAGVGRFLSHTGDLYDMSRPNDESFNDPRLPNDFKPLLYPGRFTRLRIDPVNQKGIVGPFRQPVLTPAALYDNDGGIVAYDLTRVKLVPRRPDQAPPHRQNDHFPDKWRGELPELWRLDSPLRVYIKAGSHLYLGAAGTVAAVRLPVEGEKPQVVWQTSLQGTPHSIVAADGKLFVSTREGQIYAFGPPDGQRPIVHRPHPAWPAPTGAAHERTEEILRLSGAEGYAVVLGLETGQLVEGLLKGSQLYVIAVDQDADLVERLRRRLDEAGVYGIRASVHVGHPREFSLPPYLANLITSEAPAELLDDDPRAGLAAVARALRPYGGKACFAVPDEVADETARKATEAVPGVTVGRRGRWLVVARQGPPRGAADWSHELADAANTGASSDRAVRHPLALLWFDASRRWHRKPGSLLVRVAGGRVFVKSERLVATDAYTGRLLWQRSLPFPHRPTDQMVALVDALYVTGGRICAVLDPATGKQQSQVELPDDVPGSWVDLRVWEDYLIGQAGPCVLCFDRRERRLLWKHRMGRTRLSLAAGGGKVFCAELVNSQRGETEDRDTKTLALDIRSGQVLWEISSGLPVRYSPEADVVVTASAVYHAADGTLAWRLPEPPPPDPNRPKPVPEPLLLVGNHLLWGTVEQFTPFDLKTGSRTAPPLAWVRRGCTGIRASQNLVTTRYKANCAYIDLASRSITSLWNVRPGCYNSLFPADGLLNVPDITGGCECNYTPTCQAYVPLSVLGVGARADTGESAQKQVRLSGG
ncbi:MAG TPA: hypothetical protein EYP56_00855 [Planctomycetaceae bacterium]|nr:hypothetical protein [Planctomycetaceae bacterium]